MYLLYDKPVLKKEIVSNENGIELSTKGWEHDVNWYILFCVR